MLVLKLCENQDHGLSRGKPESGKLVNGGKTSSGVASLDQQPDWQHGDLTSLQTSNENPAPESVLIEWEEPLFKILLDEKEGGVKRCSRLIEMATVTAQNVPSVQRECLKHLTYSLQDTDSNLFLLISMSPAIPLQMRVEFVREVVEIRPDELCEWLCSKLAVTKEPQLVECAVSYLNTRKAEDAAVVNAPNR